MFAVSCQVPWSFSRLGSHPDELGQCIVDGEVDGTEVLKSGTGREPLEVFPDGVVKELVDVATDFRAVLCVRVARAKRSYCLGALVTKPQRLRHRREYVSIGRFLSEHV
jgi:hypothetical protein